MRKVLVVTPAFHGYGESIGNALRRRGHDVVVHPYDAHRTLWQKSRHKAAVELPGKVGLDRRSDDARRTTDATLDVLDATRPDVVLVIRGDLLEDRFWDRLEERRSAGRAVALRRGAPHALRDGHVRATARRGQLLAARRRPAAGPRRGRPPPAQRLRPRPPAVRAPPAATSCRSSAPATPTASRPCSGCTRPASRSAPTAATGRATRSTGSGPGAGAARRPGQRDLDRATAYP